MNTKQTGNQVFAGYESPKTEANQFINKKAILAGSVTLGTLEEVHIVWDNINE